MGRTAYIDDGDTACMKHTLATVIAVLALASCAAPAADRTVEGGAVDDFDTSAVVKGAICDAHVGAFLHQFTLTTSTPDGVSTVQEVSADDDGIFSVEVSAGTNVLSVASPGYQRSFVVSVAAGTVFALEPSDGCN